MIVSLPNYTPPARYDDEPWVTARIEHSATLGGTYTLAEAINLDPVADDPAQPPAYSFTTEAGTASWFYRITWVDDTGDLSSPTTPGQNTTGVVPDAVTAFASAAELASILKVTEATNATALARVLDTAAGEIVAEIGRNDLSGWELALAAEVNLERAAEHWAQMKAPFGIIGLGPELGATHTATDSWNRHANKLAPIKRVWGLA